MITSPQARLAAIALTLSLGGVAPSGAQQAAGLPARAYVQVFRLKPEMVGEWLQIQRTEVMPAQKKAGIASRTTLVTVIGNSFEYAIITPLPLWAAMDSAPPLTRALGAEGAAAVNAKLRRCILTQQSYLTNRVDSLSIPAGDALVWRTNIRRMIPGKNQAFAAYYKAEVLPALQKAKAAGRIAGTGVAFRGVGAATGEFTTINFHTTFAEMDQGDPIVFALGAEAGQRLNAKAAEFSTSQQVIIRRRLADLSY